MNRNSDISHLKIKNGGNDVSQKITLDLETELHEVQQQKSEIKHTYNHISMQNGIMINDEGKLFKVRLVKKNENYSYPTDPLMLFYIDCNIQDNVLNWFEMHSIIHQNISLNGKS